MSRVLAIDFGTKRVGLAVTDPMQIIATGLCTVAESESVRYISDYCAKEGVKTIVIGEPKTLQNEPAEVEREIAAFIVKLEAKLPTVKIERADERFTSSLAMDSLIAGGVKKKDRRRKELLDEVSATIILQSYLERKQV